ncbi:hypothetical protein [Actinoplanes derwentensis]|uniref:Uncharacterized protein n=1 Tax=Actinoplanes derwentensis TaxID=113562 RepID=A0A1H1VHJ2_9ACTN|nr:hypothetical protein [Actinoplanes derwentensis]SDS84222.1 hypothetical protein SAMN04489716_1763 [Actinoplanes derwentensis]
MAAAAAPTPDRLVDLTARVHDQTTKAACPKVIKVIKKAPGL